jgi:hypothetical protein
MMRTDHSVDQTRSVNVWPDNPAGSGAEVMKYRFNWNFPIGFSLHDPNRLYAGSNFLHVTENGGQSWEVISPDLTRGLPETIRSSGGPITQDNTGAEFYSNLFAISESPLEQGVIWVGSDDGLIHLTRDNGRTWENVTPNENLSPKLNMINCIDPSPFREGTAYVAATSYKFGDYTPYLYKTTDYGKSWTLITQGIKANHYTRAIRSDKVREGLLYAGTEWGMYLSFDDGKNWQSFQLNLPVTSIRDLHVRDNDLIAATHGRSFWMIDDLTPLHQLSDAVSGSRFHLFTPDDAYRLQQSGWGRHNMKLEGENHPNGAIINYYVEKLEDTDTVLLDILDASGNPVQQFSNKAVEDKHDPSAIRPLKVRSGGNHFIWDLRYPGFTSFEGMVLYSSPNLGPKAVPGTYQVRLTFNGESRSASFRVVKDPRLPNTEEDYREQFDFLMAVRNEVSKANEAIVKIRRLNKDLDYIKGKSESYPELLGRIETLESGLSEIENNIHMTKNQSRQDPLNYGIRINNRLAFLMADSQRGDYRPTDQAREFFREVRAELQSELQALQATVQGELGGINEMVKEAGVPLLSWEE